MKKLAARAKHRIGTVSAWRRLLLWACVAFAGMNALAGLEEGHEDFFARYGNQTIKALNAHGYRCIKEEKSDSALLFYSVAIGKYDGNLAMADKKRCASAFINTGYLYLFFHHNAELAYVNLNRGLALLEKYHFDDLTPIAYDNLAKIYDDYGDVSTALAYYKKSFIGAMSKGEEWALLMVMLDMTTMCVNNNMVDSVADELRRFDERPISPIPMSAYAKILCKAALCFHAKDYVQALSLLEEAGEKIDAETDKARYRINHALLVAQVCIRMGNARKALDLLRKAEKEAVGQDMPELLTDIYKLMQRLYEQENRTDSAQMCQLRGLKIKDSVYNAQRFATIKELETSQAIDGMGRRIRQIETERRAQALVIGILLVGMLIIVALLSRLYIKNKELSQRNKDLYSKNKEVIEAKNKEQQLREGYERLFSKAEEKQDCDSERAVLAEEEESGKKYRNSHLDEAMKKELLDRLFAAVKDVSGVCDPGFSLNRLAETVGSKPKYISQVINEQIGKSFNLWIAQIRIEEACRRLSNQAVYGHLTIEAIAESVGYKSRTHFAAVFKRVTGLTPTDFLKMAKSTAGVS